ncbi:MAG: hypothetical protein ACLQVI_27695 [Polyangiaceae bacterium]
MNAFPIVTMEPQRLSTPANDHNRSRERRRRLRRQLKLEQQRYATARRRLQSVIDSAECLRELADFGSDGTRRYPWVVARVVRAAAAEEDRIFAIGARVEALGAQMRGYK